jgi:hypothetical protein
MSRIASKAGSRRLEPKQCISFTFSTSFVLFGATLSDRNFMVYEKHQIEQCSVK